MFSLFNSHKIAWQAKGFRREKFLELASIFYVNYLCESEVWLAEPFVRMTSYIYCSLLKPLLFHYSIFTLFPFTWRYTSHLATKYGLSSYYFCPTFAIWRSAFFLSHNQILQLKYILQYKEFCAFEWGKRKAVAWVWVYLCFWTENSHCHQANHVKLLFVGRDAEEIFFPDQKNERDFVIIITHTFCILPLHSPEWKI